LDTYFELSDKANEFDRAAKEIRQVILSELSDLEETRHEFGLYVVAKIYTKPKIIYVPEIVETVCHSLVVAGQMPLARRLMSARQEKGESSSWRFDRSKLRRTV
jgi:hypothetical protein